jgi:hypothetical protein
MVLYNMQWKILYCIYNTHMVQIRMEVQGRNFRSLESFLCNLYRTSYGLLLLLESKNILPLF